MTLDQLCAQPKSREGNAFADGWLSPLGVFYPSADPFVLVAHQYNSDKGYIVLREHGWIEVSTFLGVKLRTISAITKAQMTTLLRLNTLWSGDLQNDINMMRPYVLR